MFKGPKGPKAFVSEAVNRHMVPPFRQTGNKGLQGLEDGDNLDDNESDC